MIAIPLMGIVLWTTTSLMPSAAPFWPDPPAVAAGVAAELGINPEALASAGLTPTDVSAVLGRIDAQTNAIAQMAGAQSELDAGVNQLAGADAVLESDPSNESSLADRTLATSAIGAAAASLQSARATLLAAATSGLGSDVAARLQRFRLSAGSSLPTALRVAVSDGAKVRELESALVAERRAAIRGESLESAAASFLADCRGDSYVIAAAENLDSNLAAIRQVFETWDHP